MKGKSGWTGLEYVKTGDKRIRCYKIKPILPDKSAFISKNAVEVWISEDYAQKVIRIRARMLFGSLLLELKE